MILGQMLPCCAEKHTSHTDTADAIFSSKSGHADSAFGKTLPRLNHLFFSEFGVWMVYAMRLPVLGDFIRHIVIICSQEQMVDVRARRIVAFMKNPKSIGNCAMCQYPRDTMGRYGLIDEPKLPIPFAASVSPPFPTIVWAKNFYLRPKMFFDRGRATKAGMMPVDKLNWLPFGVAALVFVPCCKRGILSTSALAFAVLILQTMLLYPGSIFTFFEHGYRIGVAPNAMPCNKTNRLTFCIAALISIACRKASFLAAPTLTHTVWRDKAKFDYPRSVVFDVTRKVCCWFKGKLELRGERSMITHVVSPFSTFDLIRRRVVSTLAGIFASTTPVIIPQEAAI